MSRWLQPFRRSSIRCPSVGATGDLNGHPALRDHGVRAVFLSPDPGRPSDDASDGLDHLVHRRRESVAELDGGRRGDARRARLRTEHLWSAWTRTRPDGRRRARLSVPVLLLTLDDPDDTVGRL